MIHRTFLSDCFEGQIITCVVVVIFVAVFLLREWIVQNIPMEAAIAEEEDEDPVMEQQQPEEFQDHFPRGFRQERPDQFDSSLFDVDWDQQQHERPPSPVAMDNEIWLGGNESASTSAAFSSDKPVRATSMPPSFSASSSFHDNSDEGFNNNDYGFAVDNRRSVSMEPFIDTTATSNVRQPEATLIHRGHPPHAPRMRHAEAPMPIIRPILEDEEEQERPPVAQLHHRQHAPPPAPPPAPLAMNNEEEEEEENIEEFEGVLEAIGMQGSLWSLVQNCALMGLLIALSLGAAVALPYLIGMLFIMTDILDVIRIPLKLARFVTDPLVDFIFFLCTEYIGPWIVVLYQEYTKSLLISFTSLPIMNSISFAFMYIFNYIMDHGLLLADSSSSDIPTTTATAVIDTSFIDAMAKFINNTEPMVESAFERYQSFATGQTPIDRFVCISVGYIIVTIVSCWYLSRSAQNNMAAAAFGRTAQEALRHQGIIFKVGMFITIELILFPIVCGFLLDLSTMPLFKAANLVSRWVYLKQHPVPSIFLHWFLGTGFMFLFAVLVTLCRDIVRPGVMWFIRDPNDPQFHPIREIVERPIFFQFKKIGASALIYLTVILVGVGGVVHTINTLATHILPLRWSLS
jgi:E3 ubiquitin-protein ligase MARCH6